MSDEERRRADVGLAMFVALCFMGSWLVAAALRVFELNVTPASVGTRLFTTSLLYAVTMGWQPIVATWLVRRWVDPPSRLDLGLRPTRGIFTIVGGLAAVGFAVGAALVASLVESLGIEDGSGLYGRAEMELLPNSPDLVALEAALVGTISRSLAFVVTCVLLGTLFGWLRLASRGLGPVIIANTTLTLVAGLPYVVHGVDAGIRSAAFGPPGWLVLLVGIAALLLSRWRFAVQIPVLETYRDRLH